MDSEEDNEGGRGRYGEKKKKKQELDFCRRIHRAALPLVFALIYQTKTERVHSALTEPVPDS